MTDVATTGNKVNGATATPRNIEDSDVTTRMRFPTNGSTYGFTFASILKTAWALVLARNTGVDDVVFGHVVTTRGLARTSAEGLVGPCMEFVPVRVNLREDRNRAHVNGNLEGEQAPTKAAETWDLLEQVQNQHIEGMPHHAYGFPNIVRECTKWPPSTRMNTFVQHQNVEELPPEIVLQDGLAARAHVEARLFGSCDLWVVTTPIAADEVNVTMSYCGRVFSEDKIYMLLHALVAEMHRLRLFLLEANAGNR